MPGRYHLALVHPIAQRLPVCVEDFYTRDLIVLVSQNYESTENRRWQAWQVKVRCYPYWFLEEKTWSVLNSADYNPVPPAFLALRPQHLFIGQSSDGYAELLCHTPMFDRPGVYNAFGCSKYGRDEVLYCSSEYTYFKRRLQLPKHLAAMELFEKPGGDEDYDKLVQTERSG